MMGFGILVPILVLVALVYAFGWLPNQEQQPPQQKIRATSSALDVLEERYARGEISRTEYLEMRDDLSQ
jgi:uncharacterized membrane protein